MCGICGVVNLKDSVPKINKTDIKAMCDTLIHRGPDEEGIFVNGQVGLGSRRLRVIDLSTGSQPIFNEDHSICTVYNGEIYNFEELKRDLQSKGHKFSTRTDTEIIVHIYEEYGDAFLEKLNGMFAIAISDQRKQRLLLARDRMGIKPLYYANFNGKLIFASEIKAILKIKWINTSVDYEGLHHFLSLNYVPGPHTLFKNVKKLLPGHKLSLSKAELKIDKYWDCAVTPSWDSKKGVDYYAEHLSDLLRNSVKMRLRSDVALGFLLSGGIDSSAIVALASGLTRLPIKTFSIGFTEKSYSELRFAKMIAGKFGTQHYEYTVNPPVKNLLPKLIWHMEDPLADSSAIPLYYLSKIAREHVTVALSGDGGDELLAGYKTYSAYKVANLYKRLPRMIREVIIAKMVNCLPVSAKKVSFEYKAKRFTQGVGFSPLRAHYWWNGTFDEEGKHKLYSEHVRETLVNCDTYNVFEEYFQRQGEAKTLDRLLYVDTKLYLPDDILTKVDRMSMASSLEVRVPFLDNNVVEFLTGLPSDLKLRGFLKRKYLLKKSMIGLLPNRIIHRRKSGFSVPLHNWLAGSLKDMTLDLLSPSMIKRQGFFNPEFVANLLKEHYDGKKNNVYSIWGLLTFSLWHEAFIENNFA